MSLALWELAGRLLDVRQGKRLFPLITAGVRVAVVEADTPVAVPWPAVTWPSKVTARPYVASEIEEETVVAGTLCRLRHAGGLGWP